MVIGEVIISFEVVGLSTSKMNNGIGRTTFIDTINVLADIFIPIDCISFFIELKAEWQPTCLLRRIIMAGGQDK